MTSCCDTGADIKSADTSSFGAKFSVFLQSARDILAIVLPIEFIGRSLTANERKDLLDLEQHHRDIPENEIFVPQ